MKKLVWAVFSFTLSPLFAELCAAESSDTVASTSETGPVDTSAVGEGELAELSEPQRFITGAYYGCSSGISLVSHSVKGQRAGATDATHKNSACQIDLSLIGGFGAPFFKMYYAGIELEFFKRFGKNISYNGSGEIGVAHVANIGMNVDVRFGYLFPERGGMAYLTVGVAKILGNAVFDKGDHQKQNDPKGSFGSYYPTLGVGYEHKVNHLWNVRVDLRYSITSTDNNNDAHVNGIHWRYEGKPSRTSIRVSVIRTI
jgi:hypothetical protein